MSAPASQNGWYGHGDRTAESASGQNGRQKAFALERVSLGQQLAPSLSRMTGETITEAVTTALRERLTRQRARRKDPSTLSEHLNLVSERLRVSYDTRPVSKADWNAASGDEH